METWVQRSKICCVLKLAPFKTGAAKADIETERDNGNGNDVGGYQQGQKNLFSSCEEVCVVDSSLLMGDPTAGL
jgi:hypothetical protein